MEFTEILFETFWIVTGLSANIIALTLSFAVFAFTWCFFKRIVKGDKENE